MFNLTLIEITYVIKCHAFEEGKKWKLGNFVKSIKILLGKFRILRKRHDKMIKIKSVSKIETNGKIVYIELTFWSYSVIGKTFRPLGKNYQIIKT